MEIRSLPQLAEWEPRIYQIEDIDFCVGGVDGVMNLQAQQLSNRLNRLRERLKARNKLPDEETIDKIISGDYVPGYIDDDGDAFEDNIYADLEGEWVQLYFAMSDRSTRVISMPNAREDVTGADCKTVGDLAVDGNILTNSRGADTKFLRRAALLTKEKTVLF